MFFILLFKKIKIDYSFAQVGRQIHHQIIRVGQIQHFARFLIQHIRLNGLIRQRSHPGLPQDQLLMNFVSVLLLLLQGGALIGLRLQPAFPMHSIPAEIIGQRKEDDRHNKRTEAVFNFAKQTAIPILKTICQKAH